MTPIDCVLCYVKHSRTVSILAVCLQTVWSALCICSAHEALTNNIHMSRFCNGNRNKITFYWSQKPHECAHKGIGTVCVHPQTVATGLLIAPNECLSWNLCKFNV